MSSTYSPSEITDYVGNYISAVRWLIADTDSSNAEVSDQEIEALYSITVTGDSAEVRVLKTAMAVARYLMAQYAKETDFSSGGTSISSPYEHWKDVASSLSYRILSVSGAPFMLYGERTAYYTE